MMCIDIMEFKKLQMPWKVEQNNAEMRKILKVKKRLAEKPHEKQS